MKIALPVLLGLVQGALRGAALGIGAGLAFVEIFRTRSFEGYSGTLVFLTFMPLGVILGGLGGALLFGRMALRDTEIAIEREPEPRRSMWPHLHDAKKSVAFWLTAVNQPRNNAVKHSGPASPMTPVKGRLLVSPSRSGIRSL